MDTARSPQLTRNLAGHVPLRRGGEASRPGTSQRQRKLLFVIRKQLEWSEGEHQAVMARVGVPADDTGRRSTKVMDQRHWEAYVRHAQQCGFDGSMGTVPPRDRPSKSQMFRIHQLTQDVISLRLGHPVGANRKCGENADAGAPEYPADESAHKFAQGVIAQATSGKPLAWWGPGEAVRAIEALDAVATRLRADLPPPLPGPHMPQQSLSVEREALSDRSIGEILGRIDAAACETFRVSPSELRLDARRAGTPRSSWNAWCVVAYVAYVRCQLPGAEVGAYFGLRAHTTVGAAVFRVDSWLRASASAEIGDREWLASEAVAAMVARVEALSVER